MEKSLDVSLTNIWADACLHPACFLLGKQDHTLIFPGTSSHWYTKQKLDSPWTVWFRCAVSHPGFFPTDEGADPPSPVPVVGLMAGRALPQWPWYSEWVMAALVELRSHLSWFFASCLFKRQFDNTGLSQWHWLLVKAQMEWGLGKG